MDRLIIDLSNNSIDSITYNKEIYDKCNDEVFLDVIINNTSVETVIIEDITAHSSNMTLPSNTKHIVINNSIYIVKDLVPNSLNIESIILINSNYNFLTHVYFIKNVKNFKTLSDYYGSDHCPIMIDVSI